MSNSTQEQVPGDSGAVETFKMNLTLYIGISIGVGILLCLFIIGFIMLYRRGKFQNFANRRMSHRPLFFRGFSTISGRGVVDSTGEFEMINTSVTSVSSEDVRNSSQLNSSSSKTTPKKPERRKTRNSSSNNKYENVTLDPNSGFVIRKSVSMNSNIPYIDHTLDHRETASNDINGDKADDGEDDVFL